MKRATRFPLKPERLTGLPSRAGRVKSGTSEPMRSVSVVMVRLLSRWDSRAASYCSPLVVGLSNRGGRGELFQTLCQLPRLNANRFFANMGKQIRFPSAGSGQALRQNSGREFDGWRRDFATFLATADVVDLLIDLHSAEQNFDGPEQQVRGRVGMGGEAPDLETEQGYFTLEAFEMDGVLKEIPIFLRDAG